jgi:cytochrome c
MKSISLCLFLLIIGCDASIPKPQAVHRSVSDARPAIENEATEPEPKPDAMQDKRPEDSEMDKSMGIDPAKEGKDKPIEKSMPEVIEPEPTPVVTEKSIKDLKVLVFSKTAGFRHGSIPLGIKAVNELGKKYQFKVDASEDGSVFTKDNLAKYAVVIFMSTTGDVLNAAQQSAFEGFIKSGGGFVGVHSATDTEYDWPWYGKLVGAYFAGHPAPAKATVRLENAKNVSTAFFPASWMHEDEWYNFRQFNRADVQVLLTLDEKTYSGGTMKDFHPLTWCHEYDGGRAWYTGMGHTDSSYSDETFLRHLYGGILYTANVTTPAP